MNQALLVVLPAHEGLEPHDSPGRQAHDPAGSAGRAGRGRAPAAVSFWTARRSTAREVSSGVQSWKLLRPSSFRPVHRGVGVAEERLGVLPVRGVRGHAGRRRDLERPALDLERPRRPNSGVSGR
jgi:hypothetical protein